MLNFKRKNFGKAIYDFYFASIDKNNPFLSRYDQYGFLA
tara:strand:- start:679 stop:795 length:117 start_codon:yes stop_codon:yes gene_type:complete